MIHTAVLVSAFAIFWFLALFCVLPIGLDANVDAESGAPARPLLIRKIQWATAIAAVLWVVFYAAIMLHLFDL